jgi:hypothetical protein
MADAACPECQGLIAGLDHANAAAGYCMACHIEVTRCDGVWMRSPLAPRA